MIKYNNAHDNYMEDIIIYGYNSIGEAVYYECTRRNNTVLCFCEDTKVSKDKFVVDINVLTLDEIIEKKINGRFIICISNVRPVIEKLESAGLYTWELVNDYLREENYKRVSYKMRPYKVAVKEIESCILCHKYFQIPDSLFLRSTDLEITERCSLRCKECSNLMQYYNTPKDYSVEEVVGWVDSFLKYIDGVYEMRILGGEPFMHREIHRIVEKIVSYPKIHSIVIYSNATIMPTEEMWDIFENEKIRFELTNYGELSRNFLNIKKELDKRAIAYYVNEMDSWTPCSSIIKHGRDEKSLKKIYDGCCVKNTITLLNGRIYKCPYVANAINLKAIPEVEGEYVDLRQLEDVATDTAKSILYQYLYLKKYLFSCDYCNGRPYSGVEIEPAVQISEPLNYEKVGAGQNYEHGQ